MCKIKLRCGRANYPKLKMSITVYVNCHNLTVFSQLENSSDHTLIFLPLRVKPKAEVHMAVAPPVMAAVDALPLPQGGEQQAMAASGAPHLAQALPAILATPGPAPPSQPSAVLSALPAAIAVTPPTPASMANTVASPTQPAPSSTASCVASCPDVKVKHEVDTVNTSQPGEEATLARLLHRA